MLLKNIYFFNLYVIIKLFSFVIKLEINLINITYIKFKMFLQNHDNIFFKKKPTYPNIKKKMYF